MSRYEISLNNALDKFANIVEAINDKAEAHPRLTSTAAGALKYLMVYSLVYALDRKFNPEIVQFERDNFKYKHLLTNRHAWTVLAEKHPLGTALYLAGAGAAVANIKK